MNFVMKCIDGGEVVDEVIVGWLVVDGVRGCVEMDERERRKWEMGCICRLRLAKSVIPLA